MIYLMIQDPKNFVDTIVKTYNYEKIFNLGFADFCDDSYYYELKIRYSPALIPLSWITGIWVQSSVIAVLTLFCALILTTSLLAEELDKRTIEEAFPVEENALSFAIEDWLSKFNKLLFLVDIISDFFQPILAITVFYYFDHFPLSAYNFLTSFLTKTYGKKDQAYWKGILILILPLLMDILRIGTIAIVCQQLQVKVLYLYLYFVIKWCFK